MGRYIEQSDIEDLFGVENVADWSDLTGGGTADTNRITRAIAYAEDHIDDHFRQGRYAIPFQFTAGIPQTVKLWATSFAGDWLYSPRGLRDEAAGLRIQKLIHGIDGVGGVEADINQYLAGQMALQAAQIDTQPRAPVVVGV